MPRRYSAAVILALIWSFVFLATGTIDANGGWWTPYVLSTNGSMLSMLTTHFFHANALHLLSNVVLVFLFSLVIRDGLDTMNIIGAWLITAPLATAASYYSDPAAIVGASGGVLGILGMAFSRVKLDGLTQRMRTFVSLLVIACTLSLPGDTLAHVVGFLAGFVLGQRQITPRTLVMLGGILSGTATIMLSSIN